MYWINSYMLIKKSHVTAYNLTSQQTDLVAQSVCLQSISV